MAHRDAVVIDLVSSESDREPHPRQDGNHAAPPEGKAQRPPPAKSKLAQMTRQSSVPASHFLSADTACDSDGSDIEEISAAVFDFRKSKDGPRRNMSHPENGSNVATVLAESRVSQHSSNILFKAEQITANSRDRKALLQNSIPIGTKDLQTQHNEQVGDSNHVELKLGKHLTGNVEDANPNTVEEEESSSSLPSLSSLAGSRKRKRKVVTSPSTPFENKDQTLSTILQTTLSAATGHSLHKKPSPVSAALSHGETDQFAPVVPSSVVEPATKRKASSDNKYPHIPGVVKRAKTSKDSFMRSRLFSGDKSLFNGSSSTPPKTNAFMNRSAPGAKSISERSLNRESEPLIASVAQLAERSSGMSGSSTTHVQGRSVEPKQAYAPKILGTIAGLLKFRERNVLPALQQQISPVVQHVEDSVPPTDLSDPPKTDSNLHPLRDPKTEDVTSDTAYQDPSVQKATSSLSTQDIQPRPLAAKRQAWTTEDDELLVHLKDVVKLGWSRISEYFPGRSVGTLQTTYSTKFSAKARQRAAKVEEASEENVAKGEVSHRAARGRPRKSALKEAFVTSIANTDTDSAGDSAIMQAGASRTRRNLTRRSEQIPSSLNHFSTYSEATSHTADHKEELRQALKHCHQFTTNRPSGRLLRNRELGVINYRTHPNMLHMGLRDYAYSTLGPVRYMNDASGDVSTVAWSPTGKHFAAGGVAVTDLNSMQYNKRRNLVIANAYDNHVKELPDHRVLRPLVESGSNASHAMRKTQDNTMFTTVQSVAFSANGRRMYSVSIDHYLNVYKVPRGSALKTKLTGRSKHVAPVDFLSVCSDGPVATGCKHSGPNSIMIFPKRGGNPTGLSAAKVTAAMKKYPSALRFGPAESHSRYLLAGFACEAERYYEEDDIRDKGGETCLWDITTSQPIELGATNRNVFDLAWNPHASIGSSLFAVASGVTGKVNHGMHSVIRLYNPAGQNRARAGLELECPAWDINDVIYSPHDDNLIAAGSTGGKVYVWDVRQVKNYQGPLRVLEHGESLNVLAHERRQWEADTGIRFLSWGADHTRLYSGSSDGIIKCWDPYRSDEDKHIRDVVKFDSAVMSGAFSPDYESLIIGEDQSRMNLLSVGNGHKTIREMEQFIVHSDLEPSNPLDASRELLETGQIELRPVGSLPIRQAVQGPEYDGPYNNDPSEEMSELRQQAVEFQLNAAQLHQAHQTLVAQMGHVVEPCTLDCKHLIDKEEADDDIKALDYTGRFADRIPDNLRKTVKSTRLGASRPGMIAKCHRCGAFARPAEATKDGSVAKALCENCNFSCFRCSRPARISNRVRVIECLHCKLAWRVGALGYNLIQAETRKSSKLSRMPSCQVKEVEPRVWNIGDGERDHQLQSGT